MEIINNADDKFKGMQAELCGFLFDMLREINALEMKIGKRDALIKKRIPELNSTQISAEFDAMWSDFHDEYKRIVSDKCTEKLIAKGCNRGFQSPVKYGWVDTEDCTVIFQMKALKRAVIEVRYKRFSQNCASRFALIKQDGKWLVDAHNWTSDYDNIWHRGEI
ncbi:MAG: hypothetical protein K2J80_04275 [Oscillospiraceae bacterium]|nr:hypothetical protein [Oscillospiraceae bacterium]